MRDAREIRKALLRLRSAHMDIAIAKKYLTAAGSYETPIAECRELAGWKSETSDLSANCNSLIAKIRDRVGEGG
jgi:hypothetical protein